LGAFEVRYDFVLQPAAGRSAQYAIDPAGGATTTTAAAAAAAAVAVYDVNGLWSDGHGGLISAEARGSSVVFTEVPHPRTWGSVHGYLVGNTIRAVDFKAPHSGGVGSGSGGGFTPQAHAWTAAGLSTGTIGPADPFNSAYAGDASVGGGGGAW